MDQRYAKRVEDEKGFEQEVNAQTPSPNSMFFRPSNGIGWAVKQLYHGLKVRRRGWNGNGMWLALQVPDVNSKMSLPYVYMHTATGHLVPWLCSQTDLLSHDWEVAVDETETER